MKITKKRMTELFNEDEVDTKLQASEDIPGLARRGDLLCMLYVSGDSAILKSFSPPYEIKPYNLGAVDDAELPFVEFK